MARRDEGIVGRFEMPSVAPIDAAGPSRQRKEGRTHHTRNWVPAPGSLGWFVVGRVGGLRTLFCLGRRTRAPCLAARALLPRRSLRPRLVSPGPELGEITAPGPIRRARNRLRPLNQLELFGVIAI